MKYNSRFFKKSNSLAVDEFFDNVLYDSKFGYYNSNVSFGVKGDFITAPKISRLFSEMIAIWIISTWENFGKPKNLNIVELGPGDGTLAEVLLKVFQRFPEFNNIKKIYLFEKSSLLKKLQKKKFKNKDIKWINNFNDIKKGPVIFFGNEFLDAIPIKQFKRKQNHLLEKYYVLQKNYKIKEVFKKATDKDKKTINNFKCLKKINFIEFPKRGLVEMNKIVKKIKNLSGCLLIIDYGYLKPNNQNTIQSVILHKKNNILNNLGKADVTSHVNFALLKEFFLKKNFLVKKVISQEEFLKNLGIETRAEIISKNMNFSAQSNLYLRLKRLLSPKLMGNLFRVFLTFKFKE